MPTDPAARLLTVGIVTRNRLVSLRRCLLSLQTIGALVGEIIVVDDGSEPPARTALRDLPPPLASRLRIIEQPHDRGCIAGRNTMARLARYECILSLDDDAFVIDRAGIERAVDLFWRHPMVGAVAFAQAEADGRPWPAAMQPAAAAGPCTVPAYIGFAHLLRRSTFLALGAYREVFYFYGEEKDYCMRLLGAGHQVAYLPDALVGHVPDPAGREASRYLRYVVRNDCLCALFNEPWPMALFTLPIRLRRFGLMRRSAGVDDAGGLKWIVGELVAAAPTIVRSRTPVAWTTLRRWHGLKRRPQPLTDAAAARAVTS
jgi:glycosyltransferase involved in cell wall biosynthesis